MGLILTPLCIPIPMTAAGGVLSGWLLFLVLVALLGSRMTPPVKVWPWLWAVPVGWVGFLAPMVIAFGGVAGLGMILFLAFPAHLAVQFCLALFGHLEAPTERPRRLALFGLPLGVTVVVAAAAKWALYAQYGGLRTMLGYYGSTIPLFIVIFAIGLTVLLLQQAGAWVQSRYGSSG